MTPPLTLKAPMGVWFSCLTHTSAPLLAANSGQACCGVAGTTLCTSGRAASSSANVKRGMAGLLLGFSKRALRAALSTTTKLGSSAAQLDQIFDRLAAPEPPQIGEHERHFGDEGIARARGNVRGQHDVAKAVEGMIGRRWFGVEHIERGSGKMALGQGPHEGFFVEHAA